MSNKFRFFSNTSATFTFMTLISGIVILQVAIIFIFSGYWQITELRLSPEHLTQETLRIILLAKAIPPNAIHQNERIFSRQGFVITFHSQPDEKAQLLFVVEPSTVAQIVAAQKNHLRVSVPLANGEWLNIHWRQPPLQGIFWGLVFVLALLFIALLLLCYWAVRHLSIPFHQFADAAEHFGKDLQAPPMALTGSAEVQTVIKSFNEMQERIRRLLHDRTQMLAAISHDLRTPLTRLQLRAEYLKDTGQYEKALADLQEMDQMITSVLFFARDYARTEAKQRFDLNALLSSLCDDMIDAGQPVTYHESANRITFFGSIFTLKRAFTNLIDNAIKYGEHAIVSLEQHAEQIRIKIEDSGPGIPPEELEKVFAPFYRVDPARSPQKSGAGLGLAVAQDIIRAHGGEITLQNCQPHGLTVLVVFRIENEVKI